MTNVELRDEGFRLYDEGKTDEARALFVRGAEQGDAVSAGLVAALAYDSDNYSEARKWYAKAFELYEAAGRPQEDAGYIGFDHFMVGKLFYLNLEEEDERPESEKHQIAFLHFLKAYEMGNTECRELLGYCFYNGDGNPEGYSEPEKAVKIWREGMAEGDRQCLLRLGIHQLENDCMEEETIDMLTAAATDEENPLPDACAVVREYFMREGEEELAEEYENLGLELGSELLQSILDNEKEEEVGEDDWSDDNEQEFEAYDDETEAPAPRTEGGGYVIIADTDDDYRIVPADASDWNSLPKLIDAERCDNMRCNKFREVSKALKLKGTLLGQLDKDAFRKPDLEPNYHASQWYDGMAELYGNMIICLEDSRYNPFSFASEEEAQRVIDELRK